MSIVPPVPPPVCATTPSVEPVSETVPSAAMANALTLELPALAPKNVSPVPERQHRAACPSSVPAVMCCCGSGRRSGRTPHGRWPQCGRQCGRPRLMRWPRTTGAPRLLQRASRSRSVAPPGRAKAVCTWSGLPSGRRCGRPARLMRPGPEVRPGCDATVKSPAPAGPLRSDAADAGAGPHGEARCAPSSKKATSAAVSGSSRRGREAPNGAFQNGPDCRRCGPT